MMTLSVGVKLCSAECEGLPRLRGGGAYLTHYLYSSAQQSEDAKQWC